MSIRINEIGNDNYTPVKPVAVESDKKKKNSVFAAEGQFTAYMPLGGIGSLLNGKESQSTTAASQA